MNEKVANVRQGACGMAGYALYSAYVELNKLSTRSGSMTREFQ